MDLIYKKEYSDIMKACLNIKKNLGIGFLEKVYENALKIELEEMGYKVEQQKQLIVKYKNKTVGEYYADLLIDNKIIIELKTVNEITNVQKAQIINYLKATGLTLGIIINFNKDKNSFGIERIVY